MVRIFCTPLHPNHPVKVGLFPLLRPYLAPQELGNPSADRPNGWIQGYEITTEARLADLFVLTYDLSFYYKAQQLNEVRSLIEKAKEAGKPVWIFTGGDHGITYPDTYVSLLRMGGQASRNAGNQFVMPPFIPDPQTDLENGFCRPASFVQNPVLGFCGHADASAARLVVDAFRMFRTRLAKAVGKVFWDDQGLYSPPAVRARVLHCLEQNTRLTTSFIKHKKYKGGAATSNDEKAARLSYLSNICQTAYTVCLRGAGNYSVRFYDALALGRIPLLVDTDCMLPLPGLIQWQNHCFIHDLNRLDTLVDELLLFHRQFTDLTFQQRQLENRKLWLSHLCYEGFFSHFHQLSPNQGFSDRLGNIRLK